MSAVMGSVGLVDLQGRDYARGVLLRSTVGLVLVIAGVNPAFGEPDRESPAEFAQRLERLMKKPGRLVTVQLGKDEPTTAPSGITLASKTRGGIYVPPVLEPEDMMHVIRSHMPEIKRCYEKQLKEDPEWADRLILDLAVRRTGRVSEVSVAPGRVRRAAMGECLIHSVARWRFPEFTGETEEGITQEVVTASFPFSFEVHTRRR